MAKLRTYPSFQAKIRYRVNLYQQQLSGTGDYAQLGVGDDIQLRFELKLPVGDDIASLQHVCDGRHLWLRRDSGGSTEPQTDRIDLRRVRAAAGPDWNVHWNQSLVGGVPRLLSSIDSNFRLSEPLQTKSGNAAPLWKLRGQIAEPLPRGEKGPTDTPTHVEVTLDGANLLPYRVTFLASKSTENGLKLSPLVALEWFEIRLGEPIDPQRFHYRAENYESKTEEFIESVRQ